MRENIDDIIRDLLALSPADQALVRDYVAFRRWRAESGAFSAAAQSAEGALQPAAPRDQLPAGEAARSWCFSFLEHFASADVHASRDPAGMEVKTAEATVGGERRPAVWQHPPVSGESVIEFHVPVPSGLRDLCLHFAIGIRDGAQAHDRLVAFRVRADGWQVWSQAAWPTSWKPVELALPFRAGDVLRLAFATDGLGDHRWAWAVWGEPELTGWEAAS